QGERSVGRSFRTRLSYAAMRGRGEDHVGGRPAQLDCPLFEVGCSTEMAFAEGHQPVQTLLFDRSESLRIALAFGARSGVRTMRMPASANSWRTSRLHSDPDRKIRSRRHRESQGL